MTAGGGKINNHGEALLGLVATDTTGQGHAVKADFQIAGVTRPRWSVSLVLDSGLQVTFAVKSVSIPNQHGVKVCHFERKHGLHIATLQLENPAHEGFGWLGP